jgi:voltage-gated potassium channel
MNDETRILTVRLQKAGIVFFCILFIGTVGYMLVADNVSWFDGLYMTFITITTIGFEEVINLDRNVPGRVLTIFIAVSGIGTLTYTFSNIAALIIETDLNKHLKRRKMERNIAKMSQHYIICGGSRVGIHIADELEQTKRPFIIADLDEALVDELQSKYQHGKVIAGDCTDDEFLTKLNIKEATGLFITTRDDNLNLVMSVTARQLSAGIRIVSHCKNPESVKKLYSVGADKVVLPSYIGGLRMASEMVRPTVTSFLDEMLRDKNQNLRIEEVPLPPYWERKTVGDLPLQGLQKTLLLALREQEAWYYNPPKERLLQIESRLIVMTSPEELKVLADRLK